MTAVELLATVASGVALPISNQISLEPDNISGITSEVVEPSFKQNSLEEQLEDSHELNIERQQKKQLDKVKNNEIRQENKVAKFNPKTNRRPSNRNVGTSKGNSGSGSGASTPTYSATLSVGRAVVVDSVGLCESAAVLNNYSSYIVQVTEHTESLIRQAEQVWNDAAFPDMYAEWISAKARLSSFQLEINKNATYLIDKAEKAEEAERTR